MKLARCLAAVSCFAATQLSAGLLVHLPFDLDGTDASGGKHHAQAHNGAEVEPQQFKLGGGAASFDGKSGYYAIPAFTPAISNEARSVSFWERSEDTSKSTPNKIFLGWGTYSLDTGVRFDVGLGNTNNSQLRLEFNALYVVSTSSTIDLCDGDWHHVVATYEGQKVRFYVDGRPYGRAVETGAPLQTSWNAVGTVVGAGAREASGVSSGKQERFFRGQLDDVGIWNTALSAEEVRLIHGLACVGGNDLGWLPAALELWRQPVGTSARINGCTWRRVQGLNGKPGDWMQVLEPNGAGSFIVLGDNGGGLQITPRWWEGQLSQSVGLGLAVLGGAAFLAWLLAWVRWRMQVRRVEARERKEAERRRIARDLHDELGSGLTEIMQLGDLAAKEALSPSELSERLAAVTSRTRELVASMDEVVWTTNPVNDVVPRLASYLADYTQRFLRAKGTACRIEIMEGLPQSSINAKARHHLLLAVKEALNNAVKYSGATEIWLWIDAAADVLRIAIEDNGRGFDLGTVRRGNGLTNMETRLEELGGKVEIETQPGHGTRIRFTLSLKHVAN